MEAQSLCASPDRYYQMRLISFSSLVAIIKAEASLQPQTDTGSHLVGLIF
jgi:hypothetical protein